MYKGLHVTLPLLLSHFNEGWIFSTDYLKLLKCKISWKFVQCEPRCFWRTEGQIEMTNLIAVFRNFANAPKEDHVVGTFHSQWSKWLLNVVRCSNAAGAWHCGIRLGFQATKISMQNIQYCSVKHNNH